MGSLPALPALDTRVATPVNALDEYQRAANLQTTAQQQEMNQQEIQLRKQQMRDQQIVRESFVKNNGDLDKTVMDSARQGVSPQTLQGLQLHALDVKSKTADLVAKQGENALKQADLMQGAHDAITKAPAEQRPAVYQQQLQSLHNAGVDVSQMPPDYPGDDHLSTLGAAIVGHKQQVEDALKQSEIGKNTAQGTEATQKGNEAVANTEKTQIETDLLKKYGAMSPAQQEARYLNVQMQQRRGLPVSPDDAAFAKSYEHMKTLGAVTTFNLQNAGAASAPTDPLVQSVANGSMKIGDVLTPRTPLALRKEFLQNVLKVNPNFNSATYDVEKGVMKDFTSGPDAGKLQAFNTAITHMGIFKQTADALDNNDTRILNKVGNAVGMQFGSDKVTNFNIAKQAFIGEVSRAFDGAGVTMHDREQVEQQIGAASSPAQLKGAAATAEKLLRGKRDVLQQQYEAGRSGKPNFGSETGGVIYARDPQGKLHQAPAGTALPAGWKQENK